MARLDTTRVTTWRDLQSISAELERTIDDVLTTEWKVPLGWFDVLGALVRLGGRARPSGVAEELRLVRSSLSRRLDRLEEEGWVARTKPDSPEDHRAVLVVLTPRGRALWRAMNVTYRRAVQAHVSSRLSDADVGDLRRILAAVAVDSNGHSAGALRAG